MWGTKKEVIEVIKDYLGEEKDFDKLVRQLFAGKVVAGLKVVKMGRNEYRFYDDADAPSDDQNVMDQCRMDGRNF